MPFDFFTLFIFLLLLSLLVFAHELGHFVVAKKAGVEVEEFGFGLPPRFLSFKRGKTRYSLNLLPIGGFVRLKGEDGNDRSFSDKRSFAAQTPWVRTSILLAGVFMNFLLAWFLLSLVAGMGIEKITPDVHVRRVVSGSPSAGAGIRVGDVIESLAGIKILSSGQLVEQINQRKGEALVLVLRRNSQELELTVPSRKEPPPGEGPLGIEVTNLVFSRVPWSEAFFAGLSEVFRITLLVLSGVFAFFTKLFTERSLSSDVAGPLGIAHLAGEVSRLGPAYFLQLTALLSVNLALINSLPFPALDGGRVLFVLLEIVTGKRAHPVLEKAVHTLGLILLLILMALITYQDILRLR